MPTAIDKDLMEVEAHIDEDDDGDEAGFDDDEEAITSASASVRPRDDNEEEDDDDDVAQSVVAEDEEEVMAAVVVDDDEDGDADSSMVEEVSVVAEAVVAVETPKKKVKPASKTSNSSKRTSSKNSTSNRQYSSSSKQNTASSDRKSNTKKKRPNTGSGGNSPKSAAVDSIEEVYKLVPTPKLIAAREAREMLRETVPSIPLPVSETQVRSFGRLCIQSLPTSVSKGANQNPPRENSFNTTSALYPVGFSCDRFEFSPVHGRVLKMRCDILDGRSVKANQRKSGFPVQADIPDGPIFRIMWGRGVDEDSSDNNIVYPFDPYAHSPPIISTGSSKTDALLKNAVKSTKRIAIAPRVGMRVKVRCDSDVFFPGTIESVGEPKSISKDKKKRKFYDVVVNYEDGLKEAMTYPDPDLELMLPGMNLYFLKSNDFRSYLAF
jgi:hypothetical protein